MIGVQCKRLQPCSSMVLSSHFGDEALRIQYPIDHDLARIMKINDRLNFVWFWLNQSLAAARPPRVGLLAGVWCLGLLAAIANAQNHVAETRSSRTTDQSLTDFLAPPQYESWELFPDGGFPNVVTCVDGSILAIWGQTQLHARRSDDGGRSWSKPIAIGSNAAIHSGGAVVDESTQAVWVFGEAQHPPADRLAYVSHDHGLSWASASLVIEPDSRSHSPSLHMNEHGLTLQRGEFAGRLIRPTRYYGPANEREHWPTHYSNAIYSDNQGQNWHTSEPFPFLGTGEAAVVELGDGTLYYNSRRHWAPAGENPRRRWSAISRDGGQTWLEGQCCDSLPDGPQDSDYGLMAGMVRLPIADRDILVFSNVDSDSGRKQGTLWVSLDGGKTWPHKKQVVPGPFAYSSLTVGRPGTNSAGWIFLFYEGRSGNDQRPVGGTLARFNLRWLLPDVELN